MDTRRKKVKTRRCNKCPDRCRIPVRTAAEKLEDKARKAAELKRRKEQEAARDKLVAMLEGLGYDEMIANGAKKPGWPWKKGRKGQPEEPVFLLCDGFEDCAVGVVNRFGMQPLVLYDEQKMLDKLARDMPPALSVCDQSPEEMAQDYFDFNIIGAWMGDGTPAFATFFPDQRVDAGIEHVMAWLSDSLKLIPSETCAQVLPALKRKSPSLYTWLIHTMEEKV